MKKFVVLANHKSNYPEPISFVKGELLNAGKMDTEYKGWIWVTTKDNKKGWAPIQYLNILSNKQAIAKNDYSANELNVSTGDEIEIQYELNDWCWVKDKNNRLGWIPKNIIKSA